MHLVLTSPPYPMVQMWDQTFANYNSGISKSVKKNEGLKAFEKMHKLLDKAWEECLRVLVPGGFAVINVGDATRSMEGHFQMYSNHSRIIQGCSKAGFDVLPYIIWRKPTNAPNKFMGSGMLPAGAYVTLEHEHILIFRKGGIRKFDGKEKNRRRASAVFWEERNEWYSDQWDIRGVNQSSDISRKRNASFPLEIALRPILMYSIYGDTVLDPFAGFGTTSLAAMLSARNSISFESDGALVEASREQFTDPKWLKIINERTEKRILRHLDYCFEKKELFFKYRHEKYKIPIKTQQEKFIQLYQATNSEADSKKINIIYQPWPESQLFELPAEEDTAEG